ncbi:MAG: GNAT family N-acetyltransferase [Verrucomicrobiaceae bacterium]|nr:GNAT family N-acetyltransferase [Verrucomicrobiaceae bacterium]
MTIRTCIESDLPELKRITLEGFEGIAFDQNIERQFGILNGKDWRWRKSRHIDEDFQTYPQGCFVAEEDGVILGYITTRVDHEAGKGRIPNLAVDAAARGKGTGRKLIEHALAHLRAEGMAFVMIETMANNPIGQHLYPSCGFVETGRQIHYALKL